MGSFWQTTLSSIQRGQPDWGAIVAYEAPVRRYLARRFPTLQPAERDDLVQEVLLAMRERLVARYDPGAGPFRALLQAAIQHRVIDRLRRRRPQADDERLALEAAPAPGEVERIDLEARVVGAVRRVHDRHTQGGDLALVYVLSGALVHGLSNRAIARREGLSVDQVKRKLQQARAEVLAELFAGLLPAGGAEVAARCAELTRACLRQPRRAARLLEGEPHAAEVEALVAALRAARAGSAADEEQDLLRGIEAIFEA